ncbi:hypothetical protein EON64_00755 [archaeon]|nr:MAG: hypothetical protein EON64_00755 [archaeon]
MLKYSKMKYFYELVLHGLVGLLMLPLVHAQLSTKGQPLQIFTVTPSFGSVEGGTWVSIEGANFLQSGLFTSRVVFIGGERCNEISYYTTDERIVCVAPKCVAPECLASATWGGSVMLSLDVYVQTVEGIMSKSSTFTYHGGYTPSVYKMNRYSRSTVASYIHGFLATDSLADLSVKFGESIADLGDADEMNPASYNMWSWSSQIYYKPLKDMPAGFYNLTLVSQNDQSNGWRGTGIARMYPKQRPYASWDYSYDYHFDASLAGTPYSVCVQPVIEAVFPQAGSLAGGTVVTITGSGFSKNASQLVVLVAGRVCDIQSADVEQIVCTTGDPDQSSLDSYRQQISQTDVPSFASPLVANSTRNFGSPGWWMQMWNWTTYSANKMTERTVSLSKGWKADMSVGMHYALDSSWPSRLGYTSGAGDSRVFAADFSTFLVAPVTGMYQFYMTSDDVSTLFGRRRGGVEEQLLNVLYSDLGMYYVSSPSKRSKQVYLQRGERYGLRARLVNTGGPDYIEIGLKIEPNMTSNGMLWDAVQEQQLVLSQQPISAFAEGGRAARLVDPSLPPLLNLSSSVFMHHHALKEVQVLSLQMAYQYERQVSRLNIGFL